MVLKQLDEDIPSPLVQRYGQSQTAYADEGKLVCLPLLIVAQDHVARTGAGFQGSERFHMGLGLLLSESASADYDPSGRLLRFESRADLVAGLALTWTASRLRVGSDFREGGGWSILWGALGFEEKPLGERRLSFLWIPIRMNREAHASAAQPGVPGTSETPQITAKQVDIVK